MRIVVTGPIGTIGFVIFVIVLLVILYWIIRIAVREAILAAWRIRNRAEKEARDDKAQGW
jgi:hypothetical protein